jgi:hypothetical protein
VTGVQTCALPIFHIINPPEVKLDVDLLLDDIEILA